LPQLRHKCRGKRERGDNDISAGLVLVDIRSKPRSREAIYAEVGSGYPIGNPGNHPCFFARASLPPTPNRETSGVQGKKLGHRSSAAILTRSLPTYTRRRPPAHGTLQRNGCLSARRHSSANLPKLPSRYVENQPTLLNPAEQNSSTPSPCWRFAFFPSIFFSSFGNRPAHRPCCTRKSRRRGIQPLQLIFFAPPIPNRP
jgi:hypothetical protein